jgi:hypothetical protein
MRLGPTAMVLSNDKKSGRQAWFLARPDLLHAHACGDLMGSKSWSTNKRFEQLAIRRRPARQSVEPSVSQRYASTRSS